MRGRISLDTIQPRHYAIGMFLLALDTAGPDCSAAIAYDVAGEPKILGSVEERIGRGHAERLPGMVDEVLSAARISYGGLARIGVTTGPGSFTGVRIGIAFARGLALALDIPVIGIGSLEALAYPLAQRREGTVVAVLDAKRDEYYAMATDMASGAVLIEAEAMRVEDLVLRLSHARPPVLLTGAGAPFAARAFAAPRPEITGAAEAPAIADVAALAIRAKEGAPPTPLYARPADAKPQHHKAVARL